MFAVVRTGGKQYRVAEGDIIAVEKLAGEAGDSISLDDVLIAGEGEKLEDTRKLSVSAEIVEQKRGAKVTIFKKKRRKNYRRKNGHRQYLTLLKITGIGGAQKAAPKKAAADKTDESGETEAKKAAPAKKAPTKKTAAKKTPAAKKTASAEKTVAKESSDRKPAAKASPAKGEVKKKAPAKKAPAKKAAATKPAAKKTDKDA